MCKTIVLLGVFVVALSLLIGCGGGGGGTTDVVNTPARATMPVEYKTQYAWSWTTLTSTSNTYKDITGLSADTYHDVRVRASDDGSLVSSWTSPYDDIFKTLP